MKLFLWDQGKDRRESRQLLRRAVLQYADPKQYQKDDRESGQDSFFVICESEKGKPCFFQRNGAPLGLEASVTHTGDWWLCAVGEGAVGLDAELRSRRIRPSLAKRICTPEERAWLAQSSDKEEERSRALLRIWVRKEALVKYRGTGIASGLHQIDVLKQSEAWIPVDLTGISEEGQRQLEAVIYAPRQTLEGIEWLK